MNVYILLYMCGRTKWAHVCFLCAGAFLVHVVLRVNGSFSALRAALLQPLVATRSSVCLLRVFLDENIPH